MRKLEEVRQEITAYDSQIAQLLSQRFARVIEVGQIKAQKRIAVLDRSRENKVLANVVAHSEPEFAPYIKVIYQEIMAQARQYQTDHRK